MGLVKWIMCKTTIKNSRGCFLLLADCDQAVTLSELPLLVNSVLNAFNAEGAGDFSTDPSNANSDKWLGHRKSFSADLYWTVEPSCVHTFDKATIVPLALAIIMLAT